LEELLAVDLDVLVELLLILIAHLLEHVHCCLKLDGVGVLELLQVVLITISGSKYC
jgi:hypothetical protein